MQKHIICTVSYIGNSLEYLNDGVHAPERSRWIRNATFKSPLKSFISLAEGGEYSMFLEGIERKIKSGQKKNF